MKNCFETRALIYFHILSPSFTNHFCIFGVLLQWLCMGHMVLHNLFHSRCLPCVATKRRCQLKTEVDGQFPSPKIQGMEPENEDESWQGICS